MSIFRNEFQLIIFLIGLLALYGCDHHPYVEVKKEKVGNIELAYYIRGQGDPLVMIMGFRGTMSIWDPGLLEELEKNYTLILFDNRGVGFSSDTEEDLTTISQMAEDTAHLIKALGFSKAHILGWSMGSRIALELALKYPEVVDSLIVCSPNPGGKYQARRASDTYEKLTSLDLSQKEGLSLIFPDTLAGREASAAFVARLTKAMVQGTVPHDLDISNQTIERQVHALMLWDQDNQLYENLSKIKTPTLVAGGLSDVLDQPENVRTIANQIPFAWSAYFAGAGHDFLSQDYQHFAKLVTLFIESNRSRE